VLARFVADQPPPQQRQHETERGEHVEHARPAEAVHDPYDQRRADHAAQVEPAQQQRVAARLFALREPALQRVDRRWPVGGLPDAEQRPDDHEPEEDAAVGREEGEQRPPDTGQREHLARSVTPGEQAAGDLEQRVRPPERGEHNGQLGDREVELFGDDRRDHGHRGAVHAHHEGDRQQ
jgi:hypothetical protein